ncbi:hypothetical protein SRB17_65620 [Streptomyces sp. RB17]|nr:hypothetical protein [Streptomyces sp. RB17]
MKVVTEAGGEQVLGLHHEMFLTLVGRGLHQQ